MAKRVDARGLSCPQPVILAKQALGAEELPMEILVDTATSRENVRRLAERLGFAVRVEERGGDFTLVVAKRE